MTFCAKLLGGEGDPFAVPFVRPISEGFAQKVNKRVVVAVSEPGAVATSQMFNCRKLSKLMRCLKRHLLQLRLRPVATASGSDTGKHFLCKVISDMFAGMFGFTGWLRKGERTINHHCGHGYRFLVDLIVAEDLHLATE